MIYRKMEKKQRLFIYDRKEIAVLLLLSVTVAAFAFTLGIHLGKRVGGRATAPTVGQLTPVGTVADKLPNRQEMVEHAKDSQFLAEETLNQSLHDEVTRTGVRLDVPRQIELPSKAKAKNAGATTQAPVQVPAPAPEKHVVTEPNGRFTLQIGSYPAERDADDKIKVIAKAGLKAFARPAEIKGKGKWFRVYVGGFNSKEQAEEAGAKYRTEHLIDTYIVAKTSD